MTCGMCIELIEPIAAGELAVDADVRTHLESCPRCASALATARRIESSLAVRPAPAAPDRFESMVLQRIRRDRWRSEEHVDLMFNVAMALAAVLVAGGALALMNPGVLLTVLSDLWAVASATGAEAVRSAVPTVHVYLAAAGLLLSALATWWWADRTVGL